MTFDRKLFRILSISLLLAIGAVAVAGQEKPPAAAPAATVEPASWVALDLEGGGELSPAERAAVEKVLLSLAEVTNMILCQESGAHPQEPAIALLCARADRDLPRLWWKARTVRPRVGDVDFLRLVLELGAGPKAPTQPTQLVVLVSTPLPKAGEEEVDQLMAKEIQSSLTDLPELRKWFLELHERPELAPYRPAAKVAAAPVPPKAPDAKPPAAPPVTKEEKAPEPRKKIEIDGGKDAPAKAPAAAMTFAVREALVGGGFSQGVTGSLRVSPTGLGFTRRGAGRDDWFISWSDLRQVSKDTGVWDISHPLVIVDRKGRRRYIARIDEKGNDLPGDPILSAIRQKRPARDGSPDEEGTASQ